MRNEKLTEVSVSYVIATKQSIFLQNLLILYCIVLYCIILYCIVLYCIVLYCIVLYCIVLYCIVLYCIVSEKKFMFKLYLFYQMSLPFPFSSIMFVQKSFKFSITVISLSYDICIAFQDWLIFFLAISAFDVYTFHLSLVSSFS